MKILVSACLIGINCRYDGKCQVSELALELFKKGLALPVCPEQLGGLTTPRNSCEIIDGRIFDSDGDDKTVYFERGASEAFYLASMGGIKAAFLKEKSPSCGVNLIYDGSFSGKTIPGMGIFSDFLIKKGLKVYSDQDESGFLDYLKAIGIFYDFGGVSC